ncbi:MBL fold metallo-hydrolase [Fodinibius halophilus]|nr:MBL fold metallo-hydrolase [Fodinibius halophilus]
MGDKNDQISIVFWGVRGSTPCANKENMVYGGNTTCVQVDIPQSDEVLILDSGTGIRNLGNTINGNGKVRGRIFITHPHWDHIQGFPFFKPIYGSNNQFEIHMPQQEDGGCKEILSGHLTKTFFPVTLEMIDANLKYITQPPEEIEYEGYSMEYMLANHTTNTAIYKLECNGHTIIFCPDNELDPEAIKAGKEYYSRLMSFFEGADILVHDGQYDLESYEGKHGWGHSAWEVVVDFARQANVKNLFITHHDPDSTDRVLADLDEKLQREYAPYFNTIELAKEGTQLLI